VLVPAPGEYVADGAARQAAWVHASGPAAPTWSVGDTARYKADPVPQVRERCVSSPPPAAAPAHARLPATS